MSILPPPADSFQIERDSDQESVLFSIIVPYYNGADCIHRCLDSVFESGLHSEEFECIVVDDCSSDKKAPLAVEQYMLEGKHPANLYLIKHRENKRQGGARNTAILKARGRYLIFIDQDDWFENGALRRVADYITIHPELDILMVNACTINEKGITLSYGYDKRNSTELMSGKRFMVTQEIPWVPWCYIYRKQFLLDSKILFEEKVRFEDKDFVMKSTVTARNIQFQPITLICHFKHTAQQSFVGNDYNSIRDLMKLIQRVARVAEDQRSIDLPSADAVMGHYFFSYESYLKRYVWRLNYRSRKQLISEYPPIAGSTGRLTRLVYSCPGVYVYGASFTKPILLGLWRLKRMISNFL